MAAAAIGLMGLAASASAEIIYTPANITEFPYEDFANIPTRGGRTPGADSLAHLAQGAAGRK